METLATAEHVMMRKLQPVFHDWEWEALLDNKEFRRRLAEIETADEAAELVDFGHRVLTGMGL